MYVRCLWTLRRQYVWSGEGRTVSNLAVACAMKSAFNDGAAVALCTAGAVLDVFIVLALLLEGPRGAVDVPRIEAPRPDCVNWYSVRRFPAILPPVPRVLPLSEPLLAVVPACNPCSNPAALGFVVADVEP
jgi:hypothetical protein